jgi:L-serine dehydratase
MGPKKAAEIFQAKNKKASSFRVTLFGSLALTGRGHMTDYILIKTLGETTEILWKPKELLPLHTNGMLFEALTKEGKVADQWEVYSIGGGEIMDANNQNVEEESIYPLSTMADIIKHLEKNGGTIWEYVKAQEGAEIFDHLKEVWETMKAAIERGMETDGTLPGVLKLRRKAPSYKVKADMQNKFAEDDTYLFAYALAVSEENAAAGKVVTAPTCGSSGILPAVMYLFYNNYEFSEKRILNALAVAGLIGNLVKKNASISGAEVGCQGEVGTACSMAAAAITQLLGGTMYQIEYAASSGLEHHLGLTCDPIAGLVQIPCIERNAFGAQRALDAALFAIHSDGRHLVHFDNVVKVMGQTGHDLPSLYKETSLGGLASFGLDQE